MKIETNFITCTRSSDKISKLNKELFNFHVTTTKVGSNCDKIVCSLVLVFRKNCFFTEFRQNECR